MAEQVPLAVVEVLGNAIVGGMEISVQRLLSALPRDAFRVTVALPWEGELARSIRAIGHEVQVLALRHDSGWATVHRLAAIAERAGARVIHAHMANAHLVAAMAGTLAGIPVAATIHSMHVSSGDLEAQRLGDTDLICVSDACACHARAVGVPDERISVVPNAVPRELGFDHRERAPNRPFTIAWIGRLSAEKNPELFLHAVARVHDLDVRFAIVGDGPLASSLRELAHALGVAARVEWLGEVPDATKLLPRFDALACTSWHEGTPLSVLEALSARIPVIATAVGGVPEIVAHGETGLLVTPGDAAAVAGAIRAICPRSTDHRPLRPSEASARATFHDFVRDNAAALRRTAARRARQPWWGYQKSEVRSQKSDNAAEPDNGVVHAGAPGTKESAAL